jgi:transcriptional regulator with XRE-family HTH domain
LTASHNPEHDAQRLARVVGLRVRQRREELGWTQVDLEAALEGHLSRAAISYIESGKRSPTLTTLCRLALALGVHPASLLLDPRRRKDADLFDAF